MERLFYVKTPALSLLVLLEERLPDLLCVRLDSPSERLDPLEERFLLFDLLLLLLRLRSSLCLDWRYLRCINARRLRRFVKRIPVNMTNEASNNNPPATYLSFVIQLREPVNAARLVSDVPVWLRLDFMLSLSVQRLLSSEEQLSAMYVRVYARLFPSSSPL